MKARSHQLRFRIVAIPFSALVEFQAALGFPRGRYHVKLSSAPGVTQRFIWLRARREV